MAAGVSGSHSHNLPADVEIVVTLVRKTHTYTNVYSATEIVVTLVQQPADKTGSKFQRGISARQWKRRLQVISRSEEFWSRGAMAAIQFSMKPSGPIQSQR